MEYEEPPFIYVSKVGMVNKVNRVAMLEKGLPGKRPQAKRPQAKRPQAKRPQAKSPLYKKKGLKYHYPPPLPPAPPPAHD